MLDPSVSKDVEKILAERVCITCFYSNCIQVLQTNTRRSKGNIF